MPAANTTKATTKIAKATTKTTKVTAGIVCVYLI
jgi:hypothetical protein